MMFRKTPNNTNWHDYVESRLSAFIDGQLPEKERALVRKHLHDCDRCRASLETLGWTIKLLKQAPAPALPRQFTIPLPESRTVPAASRTPWLKWGLAFSSAAAAVALVALLTADFLSQNRAALTSAPAAQMAAPTVIVGLNVSGSPTKSRPQPAPATSTGQQVIKPASSPAPTQAAPTPPVVAQAIQTPAASRALPTAVAAPATANVLECQGCDTKPAAPSALSPTPSCFPCGLGGGIPDETPRSLLRPGVVPTVVTDGLVNSAISVWSLPSSSGLVIGSLNTGDHVVIIGRDDGGIWLEIFFPLENTADTRGWVPSKFVNVSIPVNALPIVTPTPTPTSTTSPPSMALAPSHTRTAAAPKRLLPAPSATPTATREPTRTDTPQPSVTLTNTSSPTLTASPTTSPTPTFSSTPKATTMVRPSATPTLAVSLHFTPGAGGSDLGLPEAAAISLTVLLGLSALFVWIRS